MALRTRRPTVDTIDLTDRRFQKLPEEQRSWLAQELGDKPRFDDISSLLLKPGLTSAQRSILIALRSTLVGDMRAVRGRAFNAEGSMSLTDVRARTLAAAQAPGGKTELELKVAEELPKSMLGHEDQVPSFVEVARRYQSPARQTAVLMAVVGHEGHGKAEALDAFKSEVLGEEAEVVTIDFREYGSSAAGASSSAALFGKDGPLSPEALKKRDPAYVPPPPDPDDPPVEPPKPGLIVLKGVEDLLKNNRSIAEGLAKIITNKRTSPDFANLIFVLDFERPPTDDIRQLVIGALGVVGTRHLAASAAFQDLSGDVLMSYAEPLLEGSLAMPGIGKVILEMDEEAEAVLKRALATPHAPLEEMEARLYEFIISKFDTHPNIDRDAAVLRVSLDPRFTRTPADLEKLIQKLHEPYADLKLGSQLFMVNLVARQVESTEDLEIALRHGKQLAELLQQRSAQMALGVPPADDAAMEIAGQVLGAVVRLGETMDRALTIAQKNFDLLGEELLPPEHAENLDADVDTLEIAIQMLDRDEAEGLPAAWVNTVVEAATRWVTAARIISETLQGLAPATEAA